MRARERVILETKSYRRIQRERYLLSNRDIEHTRQCIREKEEELRRKRYIDEFNSSERIDQ